MTAFGEIQSSGSGGCWPIAVSRMGLHIGAMSPNRRIGALDIAEAIANRLGSCVDINFMQFLAVDGDRIHLWYKNGLSGPTFDIQIIRTGSDWQLSLTELPPGAEQQIEVP